MSESKHCINCRYKKVEIKDKPCSLCIAQEGVKPYVRHPLWEAESEQKGTKDDEK